MLKMIGLALAALLSASGAGSAQTVMLTGLQGQSATLTGTDMAGLNRVSVTVRQHSAQHVFEGALLTDLLKRVGAPSGEAIRGPELADVVLVEARDGYRVALSLADIDAAFRKDLVILADREDGSALDAHNGPFQLVVEGDLRPARAARMVSAIKVIKVGP